MIPYFPYMLKIRLVQLNFFFMLHPDFAKSLHTKKIMGPILCSYYDESLVSSNLNSKLLWFHSVRPNINTDICAKRERNFAGFSRKCFWCLLALCTLKLWSMNKAGVILRVPLAFFSIFRVLQHPQHLC